MGGRVKSAKSKRMSSSQRHKIERKKREHKRDLRKAAKQLKAKGLGPKRSKKLQQITKLALKVSNAHPEKEEILNRILQVRENARVEKITRRKLKRDRGDEEEAAAEESVSPVPTTSSRQTLFIPTKLSGNFREQFNRALSTLVFPAERESSVDVPCAAYVITLDSRFAVQCMPWTLLDAIVDAAPAYKGTRKVLLAFTLTKVDLISAPALATQVSLVADALTKRYGKELLCKNLVHTVLPFSTHVEKTCRHFLRVLRQFQYSEGCHGKSNMKTNLEGKVCAFVIGLPNTGRRSLCRHLVSRTNENGTSTSPLKSAQLQFIRLPGKEEGENIEVRFAIPNAKSVTLVQFAEDAQLNRELRDVTGGDVFFRSQAFVEKTPEPETIGVVLFDSILDKLAIAQAFCQPFAATVADSKLSAEDQELKASQRFLRELGQTVRREKGFHLSPLFVAGAGTMGKTSSSDLTGNVTFTSGQQRSQATLLDVSYSNATPNKLVHISSMAAQLPKRSRVDPSVKRNDTRNALRLGARSFIRELYQSKNIPWAVMRAARGEPVTEDQIAKASEVFSIVLTSGGRLGDAPERKGAEHLNALIEAISVIVKDAIPFLPNGVVEMSPDCIAPPLHSLEEPAGEEEVEETQDGGASSENSEVGDSGEEEANGEDGDGDGEEEADEEEEDAESVEEEDEESD